MIFCDLGLRGELDGFALLRRFQEIDALQGVPVVAVTGYGLASDKARSAEAGFVAHLTKPFELPDLLNVLQGFPRPGGPRQRSRSGVFKVLVVDDNSMVARGTAKVLQKAGFDTRYACSGAEALKAAEQDCPQLALLDLQLGDMTGVRLKERIQLLPGCQSCVFLALTGSDEAEDMDSTVRAGFLAHLVKPVSFDRLLLEVERVALVAL